jgi:hypothetical protein
MCHLDLLFEGYLCSLFYELFKLSLPMCKLYSSLLLILHNKKLKKYYLQINLLFETCAMKNISNMKLFRYLILLQFDQLKWQYQKKLHLILRYCLRLNLM